MGNRFKTFLSLEAIADKIPPKLAEALSARHAVTAHKKADQGILMCEQLARLARELRAEFVEIKVERPLKYPSPIFVAPPAPSENKPIYKKDEELAAWLGSGDGFLKRMFKVRLALCKKK